MANNIEENGQNKAPNSEKTDIDLINEAKDKRLASIRKDFENTQSVLNSVAVNHKTKPSGEKEGSEDVIKTISTDEINDVLIKVFKEVVTLTTASHDNIIQFAKVHLKKSIIELKNVSEKKEQEIIDKYRSIWEAFNLTNNHDMQYLNIAINSNIEKLANRGKVIKIKEAALSILNRMFPDSLTEISDNSQFGGGMLPG